MTHATIGASGSLALILAEACIRTCTTLLLNMHKCFHLYHCRLEMPLMRRWNSRDSTLFTQSVFQLIRIRNHLYRTCKWVHVIEDHAELHGMLLVNMLDFLYIYIRRNQVEGSSFWIAIRSMHVRFSAKYVLTSSPHQKQMLMITLQCAGFHTGYGATKLCLDHIWLVFWWLLEAEPKQWDLLSGIWSMQ